MQKIRRPHSVWPALLMLISMIHNLALASGSSIQSLARQSRDSIEQLAANPISQEQALGLWENDHLIGSEINYDARIVLKPRLDAVFYGLLRSRRIHLLTPETKSRLNINEGFCTDPQHCHQPRAFYLPLPGIIFLESTLPKEEMAAALFHEVFHAYQFTYRFPLDLMMISNLVDQKKLSPEYTYDFLSYFYESQANWQTLKTNLPQVWKDRLQSETPKKLNLLKVTAYVAAAMATGGATLAAEYAIKKATTKNLPDIDRKRFYNDAGGENYSINPGPNAALSLHELQLQTYPTITGLTSWDSSFHRDYAKAVEKTYFGKLDFIFQNNIPDYQLFNPLHNQYYNLIGTKEIESEQAGCESLISRALSTDSSPVAFWLSLPAQEFQQCSAYSAVGEYLQKIHLENLSTGSIETSTPESAEALADRNLEIPSPSAQSSQKDIKIERRGSKLDIRHEGDSLRSYSRSLMEIPQDRVQDHERKSPFLILKGEGSSDKNNQLKVGGEGTTPDLPVLPVLPVLPQLVVLPEAD